MLKRIFILLILLLFNHFVFGQRQVEKLNRGVVAVRKAADSVYISWRILGTEPADIAFNLYRQSGEEKPVKLNVHPLTKGTNFTDGQADLTKNNRYFVKAMVGQQEQSASASWLLPAQTPVAQYLTIPLKTPVGYTPNDASVGDLDGDGTYEIILHQAGRGRDNAANGLTDPPILQAYKLDGTLLWQINLGINIREGAHYTQFMVYDLDGDGIAELACKTADGTRDGLGKIIGDSTKDYRNANGKILTGPEYFTIFSGKTGAELATVNYIPDRGNLAAWGGDGGNGKNDKTGNRADRFNACIAYLDGVHPSVVMCRGYYGRTVLAAWDWQHGKLTSRWVFDTKDGKNPFSGMGNHNLSVADVDQDGKDEIIYGAMCVDDDGKGLYTTGLRHGDAIHVSDLDPEHPGLEVFGIHEIEEGTKGPGVAVYDAKNGKILWHGADNEDVGRGVADNIDATRFGAQMWWSGGDALYDIKGNRLGAAPRSINFLIYWDGDFSRELLDGNRIDKYGKGRLFTASGASANNGTKSTPTLSADILGDWREELILRSSDNQSLRLYISTIPTDNRTYTLMHDPQYRLSIAWQNDGYNQPPHTGFYFGYGMKKAPKPNIKLVEFKNNSNEKK